MKDEGSTETVTEYSYDDNGNQVEKEVWIDNSFDSSETNVYNGFNHLVSVSNDYADMEYTYGPSGLRLAKTVDNEQIYFINAGDDAILLFAFYNTFSYKFPWSTRYHNHEAHRKTGGLSFIIMETTGSAGGGAPQKALASSIERSELLIGILPESSDEGRLSLE